MAVEKDYIDELLLALMILDYNRIHDWFWDMVSEYFTIDH